MCPDGEGLLGTLRPRPCWIPCCPNKAPPTRPRTEIYSLSVLEASSLKSSCQEVTLLLETIGGPLPCLCRFWECAGKISGVPRPSSCRSAVSASTSESSLLPSPHSTGQVPRPAVPAGLCLHLVTCTRHQSYWARDLLPEHGLFLCSA